MAQLMDLFRVTRKTIHNWFVAWETQKLVGLYDRPGRGRKATFSAEQREQIRQWVKHHPKQLQPVLDQIETQWEIRVSKDMLKRVLKYYSCR